MIAIDTASGIHKDNVTGLIELFAICAMWQRSRRSERDDAECRAACGAEGTVLFIDKAHHFACGNAGLNQRMRPAMNFKRQIHRVLNNSDFIG